MNIYKVYDPFWNDNDDKWEEIMGDKQIREFALSQLGDKGEEFIYEHDGEYIGEEVKKIFDKIDDIKDEDLTIKEVDTIFKAFGFEYEELNVY